MAMSVDCPVCRHSLAFNPAHNGRPGLCTKCRTAILIPAPAKKAETRALGRDSGSFRRAQSFARVAIDRGLLKKNEAEQLYKNYQRRLREGERGVTFEAILVEEGVLTPSQSRELMSEVNQDDPEEKKKAAATGDRECPNCYERIQTEARSCRFCGLYLAQAEVQIGCANCGAEHPKEAVYCTSCGADIRTGVMPGMTRVRCPKCGNMAQGMEEVCAACGTVLKKSAERVKADDLVKQARQFWRNHKGWIALAALVFALLWLWTARDSVAYKWNELRYGEKHLIQSRAEDFVKSLEHKDHERLSAMMRPESGPADADDVEKRLWKIAGLPNDKAILDEIKIEEIDVDGDRASVYLKVVYDPRIEVDPDKIAEEGSGALHEALRGAQQRNEAKITWRWVYEDGTWYYEGPF
ncbi:MAG: zinc ribbon domain-containing protein [Planctomycetes bacterium]|nr:zinc ribbon domain-containing protein [Planctomycetota bacterium]